MSTDAPDWIVKTANVSNATGGLSITGINLSASIEIDREFRWNVGYHAIDSARYDWSGCVFGPGAQDKLDALRIFKLKSDGAEVPTWHVVIDTEKKILASYPAESLSHAQEFARRTSAQAGESVTRVEQVRDWPRPRVGDVFKAGA